MYDESTNTSSAVNFIALKRECFKISKQHWLVVSGYPNIAILASEYEKSLDTMPLEDVALLFKDNHIGFIRLIRERFVNMGLLEAKLLADALRKRNDEQGR